MALGSRQSQLSPNRLAERRARVAEIRSRARRLFDGGASGVQVATAISESTDAFLLALIQDAFQDLDGDERPIVEQKAAVVAVGGTGRGELSPYSDIDLLFLFSGAARDPFHRMVAEIVRDCWDAGTKIGHAVRTIGETAALARQEAEVATALVESRLLWGSRPLYERFRRRCLDRVLRTPRFVEQCLRARQEERLKHGGAVSQLEPDVKRSFGGLRDLHLIGWIGFARFGAADVDSLRLRGVLRRQDARSLSDAYEFLTRIRIDLHLVAGRANDVLSRDEQLRIASARRIEGTAGQRPVERFMQMYFQHSTFIARTAERFDALYRPRPPVRRLARFVMNHRVDGMFKVGGDRIDVCRGRREHICDSIEQMLRFYLAAARERARPVPEVEDRIKQSLAGQPEEWEVTETAARLFLKILACTGELGSVLRSMYEVGLLERVLPPMQHARCLLQFNQYHSYTVDEHTLRAVEAAEDLQGDESPIGAAYQGVHHKDILHLALLLHDLGKGYAEDHSEVGRRLAEETADRLRLDGDLREMLVFLVHRHLRMSHMALRRDTSDPELLLEFSHEVGSPETLRMLYVLTAADLRAVGPGVWTSWKAELLTELYERAMLILSGKPYRYQEEERLKEIKLHVRSAIVPVGAAAESGTMLEWIDRQTDAFPSHYLMSTEPSRIAVDLDVIHHLRSGELKVEGANEPDTGTVDYRVIASAELAEGCFHKLAGVLTAKRMEILTAQICTTLDGTVVDSFRVTDSDFSGPVPQERIDEVASAIRGALTGRTPVEQLFQRYARFGSRQGTEPISNLPTRVAIDNDSSDYGTVIDIFAHDRPGLLYTISREIYELDLSVSLAKISTHLDQVVDVFYVTDSDGNKVLDGDRLKQVRAGLERAIEEFEREGHLAFAS